MEEYYRADVKDVFSEKYNYKEGCIPETGKNIPYDYTFKAKSLKELIAKIKDYFEVDKGDIELNACGEMGRMDIWRIENTLGDIPTEREYQEWKNGKRDLWYAVYVLYVDWVQEMEVEL